MASSNLVSAAVARLVPRAQWLRYAVLVLVCGAVYVGQHWSPSSYGIVLRQLGVQDTGLVFGEPRPIRSDEWAVVTPLTQATVNNGFERTNKTSFYKEDLRINYGMPIFDWGLIFKPTMWAYLVVDAARAYSSHWFAVTALFIVGHALLFARLGLGRGAAIFLAIGLYFTGFAQFWWSEKGPVFALFPWTVWVLLTSGPVAMRLALFYWLSASWLITNFYPPLFLSLAFVAATILLAFGREWLQPRRLLALLVTTALAGATAALYLESYLRKTATTVYPGHRSAGGGAVPWSEWFAQFFPFGTFDWNYQSVIGQNTSEVGCVGAAFLLMILCFRDYGSRHVAATDQVARRRIVPLVGGLALMYAWMLLPLPSWAGAPLLWNHVQPERMEYAAGLLLMLVAALWAGSARFMVTPLRFTTWAVVVVAGWVLFKGIRLDGADGWNAVVLRSNDLVVVPVLLVALALAKRFGWPVFEAMLGASAVSGALVLIGFNPIQSTVPIFARHDTPVTRSLDEEARALGGTLAIAGMPGAVFNGLGYASVAHVTAVPALDFWRSRYPAMPEDEFLQVFNRYSHVHLENVARPSTPSPDVVDVPIGAFWPGRVEIPDAAAAPTRPLWFRQGQKAEGALVSPRAGRISDVAVLIGTGGGVADGVLKIRLCSELALACADASRPLVEAMDNAYLSFTLKEPLTVNSNDRLRFEISLDDGANAVAFWTHDVPSEDSLLRVDGSPENARLQFRMGFQ
ncbi:DUF7657 domain-containing protein [Variovorax sp. LT1P1]|uniref:DUF7657 domain-containing protein n=1 Tax=Variovorax sp. LT1P1 TaxID=3443730 RepID=UPI003F48EBF9